jgi:hypothetical protein
MELLIYTYLLLRDKPSCYYSCFVFLINVIFNWIKGDFLYGLLFLLLFITSQFFYIYDDLVPFLLDKIAIFLVVFYGFMLFMIKKKTIVSSIIIFSTFLATHYLYFYGYLTDSYCYSHDGDEWQSVLHIASCIGHLAILFM